MEPEDTVESALAKLGVTYLGMDCWEATYEYSTGGYAYLTGPSLDTALAFARGWDPRGRRLEE